MIDIDKAIITVKDNGPYQIKGNFEVIDSKGNTFTTEQDISLCRCGRSSEKPYCDGTHEEIGFNSCPRANELTVEV